MAWAMSKRAARRAATAESLVIVEELWYEIVHGVVMKCFGEKLRRKWLVFVEDVGLCM